MEGFPKRLKEIRKARGMTQTELARRIGVSKSVISHYEAGKRKNIAYPYFITIAQALDVSIDELLEREVVKNELGVTRREKKGVEDQQKSISDKSRDKTDNVSNTISKILRSWLHRRKV